MATAAPDEPGWREKYFESLTRLETQQRQHESPEASLRASPAGSAPPASDNLRSSTKLSTIDAR